MVQTAVSAPIWARIARPCCDWACCFRGEIYKLIAELHGNTQIDCVFAKKLAITLGDELAQSIVLPVDWFSRVQSV